jgi:hypothetical protein
MKTVNTCTEEYTALYILTGDWPGVVLVVDCMAAFEVETRGNADFQSELSRRVALGHEVARHRHFVLLHRFHPQVHHTHTARYLRNTRGLHLFRLFTKASYNPDQSMHSKTDN